MLAQLVWVDIPVIELDRAIHFYQRILNCKLRKMNSTSAVAEHPSKQAGFSLFINKSETPSQQGPIIYLAVNQDISNAVLLVKSTGGKVIRDVHTINPFGKRAIIIDSEGNRLALHQSL